MKAYNLNILKAEFTRLGYEWHSFHLIGIRSKANTPNKFDDVMIVVSGETMKAYSCTTNPGTHWLQNLLNPKGTALLKPAQYIDTWQIGMHQGKYEALVQAKPVTVYRDADKDIIAEETTVTETGMFGINIHRANPSITSVLIDKWSAGCQVLNNPADFKQLLDACKQTRHPYFIYTLLNEF